MNTGNPAIKDGIHRILPVGLLLGVLVIGCARLPEPIHVPDGFFSIGENPRIDTMVSGIAPDSAGFDTFKGMGFLKMWKPDTTPYTVRLAWAAQRPDRLRAEFMDLMGKPVISWVGNRDVIQVLSIADGALQETRGDRLDLDRMVSVPISIGDLVTVLSGKIPIVSHRYRKLEESGREIQLSFYDAGLQLLETIRFDVSGQGSHHFVIAGKKGKIQYEGWVSRHAAEQNPKGPAAIQITDGAQSGLSLEITSFFPDAAVGEHVFHLKAPS